ncbi:STAU [Lepeophtheirus salmonis]|uniref:STAU n=1 Tax=Lepeophtheirus salmonis TaxID=72036 RepID=A0A7R8GYW3_LEPSM|nr:STAU [Lepeophtheirus salmonis]CAF2753950.1 STAU [Lepeophtheirus salmonis]
MTALLDDSHPFHRQYLQNNYGVGGGGGYNFPSWNYGCTLENNTQTGAFETFYNGVRESKRHEVPIASPVPPPSLSLPSSRQHHLRNLAQLPRKMKIHKKKVLEEAPNEQQQEDASPEKPIQEILEAWNGKQVSEEGPPHMKVFTWCLKIGDISVVASANSKKGAKNKAAEDMARKLDKLPKAKKRAHPFQMMGYPPPMMYGMNPMINNKEGNASSSSVENKPKLPNPSQDNPISQLYEYCKRIKGPEPVFTTISEKPIESCVTDRGFYRKKVEFTLQVEVAGKKV